MAARQGAAPAAARPLTAGARLDVVVPSAHPPAVLDRTLPALGASVDRAGIPRGAVVVCDDAVPPRPDVEAMVGQLGFRYVATGGRGAGPARNAGAATGTAESVMFVDDDVVLDAGAIVAACGIAETEEQVDVVVGGLRPPEGGPAWWGWTYADATITPAAAAAGDADLSPEAIGTGLVLIRRRTFETAGGFPDVRGIEDALFGLRLAEETGGAARVVRRTAVSGVHLYSPTWDEWLERSRQAGARLRAVFGTIDERSAARLIGSHQLGGGMRSGVKRLLGYLPMRVLRLGRGRLGRRLAAAGAEARGWRLGHGATR